jgi:hypothetical protein
MSQRRLNDWLSSHIEYTDNSESPIAYHTWSGISCIAAALQRKVYVKWGHSTFYPNHYIILVGPSGQSRKGEPVMIARDIVEGINVPTIGEDNTQEAIIVDMKYSFTDYTDAETGKIKIQSAVSCFVEELSVFTGFQNSTFLAYLTNWYDSRDKWTRRTKHQGTDEIIGMCFNLLAATAPDWLPHILTREATGGGFTSRCLFIVEEGKGKTISNPNLNPPNELLRDKLIHDLEVIHTLSGEMAFNSEALALYEAWYQDTDRDAREGRVILPDTFFDGYRGRRPAHLIKLSMSMSASRGADMTITANDFIRAKALLDHAESKMHGVLGGLGRSKYAEDTEAIIAYIQRKGLVKKSELLQMFWRNVSGEALEAILSVLSGMKLISVERDPGARDTILRYCGEEEITIN